MSKVKVWISKIILWTSNLILLISNFIRWVSILFLKFKDKSLKFKDEYLKFKDVFKIRISNFTLFWLLSFWNAKINLRKLKINIRNSLTYCLSSEIQWLFFEFWIVKKNFEIQTFIL